MFQRRILYIVLAAIPVSAIVYAQMQSKQPATPAAPAAQKADAIAADKGSPDAPAKPSRFDEIDTNHDGFVSREEYLASEQKRFAEFDTNHDGKIDAKEVANSPQFVERNMRTAERMLKQWDTNGDGVVTAEEFDKATNDRFAKQDKDGTGKLARRGPPMGMPAPMSMKPGQSPASPVLQQPQPVPPAPKPKP
jgi:hypothetical protein